MVPDFQALCSRGLHPLWIDTSNAQDLFEYCIWLATEGGGLWRRKHTKEVSEETVEFFIENRLRLQEISPREMQTIAEVIQNNRYDAARKQRRLAHLLHKENVDGRELRDVPIPKLVGDEGHRQWEPVPCMS
jgi:hypothetical protein